MNFIIDNLNSICEVSDGYLLDIEPIVGGGYDIVKYYVEELGVKSITEFKSLGLNEEVYEVERVTLVRCTSGGVNHD